MDISFGYYIISLVLNFGVMDLAGDECLVVDVDTESALMLDMYRGEYNGPAGVGFHVHQEIIPEKNMYKIRMCGGGVEGGVTLGSLRHEVGHVVDFVFKRGRLDEHREHMADMLSIDLGNSCDDVFAGLAGVLQLVEGTGVDDVHMSISSRMDVCNEGEINGWGSNVADLYKARWAEHKGEMAKAKFMALFGVR
jgi:hypothetical protein